MTDESNVVPITKQPIKQTDLPESVQKQIVAIRRVTTCHNILTRGNFEYSEFDAVAASINFLQKLYMDIAEEIVKCPEAEQIEDLKPLFEKKRQDEQKSNIIKEVVTDGTTKED